MYKCRMCSFGISYTHMFNDGWDVAEVNGSTLPGSFLYKIEPGYKAMWNVSKILHNLVSLTAS